MNQTSMIGVPPPQHALTALRQMTQESHQALHVHPLLKSLGDRQASREQLGAAIAAFYGFHAAAETPCFALAAQSPIPPSPHLARLREDLVSLGYSPAMTAALPVCAPLPETVGLPEYLGYLYVTEGASLGGQIIARGLAASLGQGPDAGYRYFAGDGAKLSGARWKRYLGHLETLDLEAANRAAEYAATVFSRLERWLWTCYRNQ